MGEHVNARKDDEGENCQACKRPRWVPLRGVVGGDWKPDTHCPGSHTSDCRHEVRMVESWERAAREIGT